MTRIRQAGPPILIVALIAGLIGYIIGCTRAQREQSARTSAHETTTTNDGGQQEEKSGSGEQPKAAAQPAPSPVEVTEPRGTYYPTTEALAPDEMRIISLGTGMPNPRPSQKATCWLVELGNGDKFLFDLGTGAAENIAALQIPYDYLDKAFLSHLHTDHFGDFGTLYVGGLINGRTVPLRIWGPSGPKEEWGTKYAIAHWRKALSWDVDSRAGRLPASGQELEVNEFDYKVENQIVYEATTPALPGGCPMVKDFMAEGSGASGGHQDCNPGVAYSRSCKSLRIAACSFFPSSNLSSVPS